MKIVVTGGSGKVGQYVVRELVEGSHKVIVLDKAPPATLEGVRWVRGDVQDFGEVMSALIGTDAVIHMAAFTRPYREVPNHVLFRTNVVGAYNVHEAAYCLGIRRIVSTSSSAVLGWAYGERELRPHYLPIDEDHPVNPQDPYGLSKLCGEHIARSYALKSEMETIVLRPASVVLPEIARQWRQQGGRRRDKFHVHTYVDVRDLAVAYRQAVTLPGLGHQVLFVVADDSTSSEPLCDLLPRLMPGLGDMAISLTGVRSAISNLRARQMLKWQPRHSWRVPD